MSAERGAAPRSAVVTGASSGLGRATALALDRAGWRVFAGVRSRPAAAALRKDASGRLTPVLLDVTKPAQVAAAAAAVRRSIGAGAGLEALVSNAGIVAAVGPLEFTAADDIRRQLDVNLIGHLAVIKAFLPLLRAARGRILITGSVLGRIPLPLAGAYCAAERGLQAVADALRAELRPWRVSVSLVEASATRTSMMDKGARATVAPSMMRPPDIRNVYVPMIERGWADIRKLCRGREIAPERFASVVLKILAARRPRARYVVGAFKALARIYPLIPTRLVDARFHRVLIK